MPLITSGTGFNFHHVAPLDPDIQHMAYFRRFPSVPGSAPNLVPDAHIASLAMEYDAEVHSADSTSGGSPEYAGAIL